MPTGFLIGGSDLWLAKATPPDKEGEGKWILALFLINTRDATPDNERRNSGSKSSLNNYLYDHIKQGSGLNLGPSPPIGTLARTALLTLKP